MQSFSSTPFELVGGLWRHRQLVGVLTRREIVGRYRGSWIGLAWSFLHPLLMLLIYTLVFSGVFHARWGATDDANPMQFAMVLFVGLIVHGLMAECVNRAPELIVSNANYVKKVVFPLEILPWVSFLAALFHAGASLLVWLVIEVWLHGALPWTALLLPVLLLPLMLGTLGVVWFLSALGVFLRDIGHITGMLTTALLFLSAVFFPISALPHPYQEWMRYNPLALSIDHARQALIYGRLPAAAEWASLLIAGLLLGWLGFAWFQRTRKGFADVL